MQPTFPVTLLLWPQQGRPGSQDRPQPRPKTIQAHAILFCVYAFRVCLGALVRLAVRLAALVATGAYGPAARITTRVASRWVLDPD